MKLLWYEPLRWTNKNLQPFAEHLGVSGKYSAARERGSKNRINMSLWTKRMVGAKAVPEDIDPQIHLYLKLHLPLSFQFSSVQSLSRVWLCNPMDCSTPSFPVHHQLPEFTQTHVHRCSDAIQPSHPLLSPCPLAFNLSQDQGLSKWVSSSHQMAKVLEFQLQHQSFQWIFKTDFF